MTCFLRIYVVHMQQVNDDADQNNVKQSMYSKRSMP